MASRHPHRHSVAVIGGGVVGCAILRRLALAGLAPIMLESSPDILGGASKANSAILHTGFDAPPNSLELACMQRGYRIYLEIRKRLNLPLIETSAFVVAWNAEQAARLPTMVEGARRNGVNDVRLVSVDELLEAEPFLSHTAVGALLVPGEHVIDPWSAPLAYALQAVINGAVIRGRSKVLGGRRIDDGWCLETTQGPVMAHVVINCAGLHGDLVEGICRESPFTVTPRKGQFVVFDNTASELIGSIILPVPDARTKGVLLARTAFGKLLLGPTAEDQSDRERAEVDGAVLANLIARGQGIVPRLAGERVVATFAGLRPATEHKDYVIEALPGSDWITVGGIRSTGLTAALGIAEHVADLYGAHFGPIRERPDPIWVAVPNLCEDEPRAYQSADCGEIVCHCERVTHGEVVTAFSGPFPAGDLGGLRRRTRCMLGRCQGFYCTARIVELAAGHFDPPLARPIEGPT